MPYKLIAVDVDGTLLNDHHQLTERTTAVLRQAIARGVQMVIATGKTRASTGAAIADLGLRTPGVYLQGLIIATADGQVQHQINLPDDVVREAVETAVAADCPFTVYKDTQVFTTTRNPHTDIIVNFHEPVPQATGTIDALMAHAPLQKIILINEPPLLDGMRPHLEERFAGRADLVRSRSNMLEIVPPGSSKGAGLRRVLDELGVDPAEVIAFGDGENDLEMIRMCGLGVAMENAMPILKDAADYVTASNNEDGVAAAVEKFVLER